MALGVVLAVVALIVRGVGVVIAMRHARSTEYPAVAVGIVLGLLILGGIGGLVSGATSVPPIHNISTDLEYPPPFRALIAYREGANPHAYDAGQRISNAGTLGDLQRAAYPDVSTLQSAIGVVAAVERAVTILQSMGLQVVDVDPEGGIVEATATTFWFGFKDDVVVRLREHEGGTLVDLHSVSRVGQGDLGANARRILKFLERFAAEDGA